MRYVEPLIDVDFGEQVFEKMFDGLQPGEKLTATRILTALDEEGDVEAFAQMDLLCAPLDISDLPRAAGTGEAAVRLRREEQLAKEGRLLTGLEDTDPLRLYLEEIAAIPVCGDIHLLADELNKANAEERDDPELLTKLLNLSLSRVVEIAQEFTGYGVLLLDLIQEGSMYLWQVMPRYIAPTEYWFDKFRDSCIRYAMKKAVIIQAHASGVGQKMRAAMEDYRAVDERLLAELGRNATIDEIAEELHMSAEETAVVKNMLDNARMLNQARAAAEPEEETEDDERHVEDTALFQARQRILDLLSGVSEADAKLLTLRFGLEGGLPLSPEETGRRLGLTPEEVVAREAAALAQLRNG